LTSLTCVTEEWSKTSIRKATKLPAVGIRAFIQYEIDFIITGSENMRGASLVIL
jgi:hypothetical protein